MIEHFFVNRSKNREIWLNEEEVELSALILHKVLRVEQQESRFAMRVAAKRKKDEILMAKKRCKLELEAKKKREE